MSPCSCSERDPRSIDSSESNELLDNGRLDPRRGRPISSRVLGWPTPTDWIGPRPRAQSPTDRLADEPVSALDVSVQAQILNLMKGLQDQHTLSYVFISHDLAVVYYMADSIGVMYLGKIVEIGDAESVFRAPSTPIPKDCSTRVPVPDPRQARSKRGDQVRGELPSPINPPSGCRFRTRCPRAQEICAAEEPLMVSYGERHQAACHFR